LSAGINELNNAAEVNQLFKFTTAGSINEKVMDIILLLKCDNRRDNQLKLSFLRKKKIFGKSLPPKQTEEVCICICKGGLRILAFYPNQQELVMGQPPGREDQRWPF